MPFPGQCPSGLQFTRAFTTTSALIPRQARILRPTMGLFSIIISTLFFIGAAGSADDVFDLTDALDPAVPSQINPEKELCPNDARDIAFLIDGSTTVRPTEFMQFKLFIALMMKSFPENTQFSLLQFSNRFQEHFDFRHFHRNRDPDRLMREVHQLGGSSYTASGIKKALELFTTQKGARSTAKRFLVVLTDGEKFGDTLEYGEVIEEANRARVTRFAIGVGLVFTSKTAQRELHSIGSHPITDHVIVVRHFSGLRDIQTQLKEKICASHGLGVPHSTRAPPRSTDTCTTQPDPQVLQKLEQVLRGLDLVKTKLDLLEARQGKCGHPI
ncbi:integrin alpha-D-like [Sceloporus undulatus]|uniref:integrin alpha-D-like n=1 Tax=Sceloporus undulatus TaxID=8520 RepID=UPI001C4BC2E2|nr:integrin alpha-D-like [Sceloporus undulatus]